MEKNSQNIGGTYCDITAEGLIEKIDLCNKAIDFLHQAIDSFQQAQKLVEEANQIQVEISVSTNPANEVIT